MRRFYHDHVNYAFSSAHTVLPDKADSSTDKSISSESEFELGIDLLYKDGNGNNETVVYEGASIDGVHHTVRKQDGTKITTLESHLWVLDQPHLCNIPSTPLDYYKEVEKGLTKEEVQRLAYPLVLSPVQQELMSWHHRLYHLPFWWLFQYAKMGYLPKQFLDCRSKPPMCIACQFGQAHRRP